MKRLSHISLPAMALFVTGLLCGTVRAEVKIIESDSTYVLGDNDSKIDARRIAVQEAKRKALELAGAYVESLSQVKNYQLTKDEVKVYTAGILETEVVSEHMGGTTEHPEISIKARCKIDTDVVTTQISRYRDNEDLKEQLSASAKENDNLKKERDALVKQLFAQTNKTKTEETRKKLDIVLSKEEANDNAHSVWVNLSPSLFESTEKGRDIKQADLENASLVLEKAVMTNPQNLRARCLLAAVHQREGKYDIAERELRAAIEQAPSNPMPHMRLGDLLKEQGRYKEALREFHFVERMRPHNPIMLFYTGMTFKDMGKCGNSVQYLNRFLKSPQVNNYPAKKESAVQSIEECGGNRPGRVKRAK